MHAFKMILIVFLMVGCSGGGMEISPPEVDPVDPVDFPWLGPCGLWPPVPGTIPEFNMFDPRKGRASVLKSTKPYCIEPTLCGGRIEIDIHYIAGIETYVYIYSSCGKIMAAVVKPFLREESAFGTLPARCCSSQVD